MTDFENAIETLEKAADILRLMAAEETSDPGAITGYYVDAPSSLPRVEGSIASIMHVEPQDWPKGDGVETTAAAAHATHVWDGETQPCVKCGIPHPVFIAQGWPACPNAGT
jgi:hypothetical protein